MAYLEGQAGAVVEAAIGVHRRLNRIRPSLAQHAHHAVFPEAFSDLSRETGKFRREGRSPLLHDAWNEPSGQIVRPVFHPRGGISQFGLKQLVCQTDRACNPIRPARVFPRQRPQSKFAGRDSIASRNIAKPKR